MFKIIITTTFPSKIFSTREEFVNELEKYYDPIRYSNAVEIFQIQDRLKKISIKLLNSNTLQEILEWDSEVSYLDFYKNADSSIEDIEAAGFSRTVTTETI